MATSNWITNALEANSGPDETENVQLKGSEQDRPAPPCQFAVNRRRSSKTGPEATTLPVRREQAEIFQDGTGGNDLASSP
jgi:hypothetical protein